MTVDVENGQVDLYVPVTTDRVLEVRRGKMKKMEGLEIMSGIDKKTCDDGPVMVGEMGIEGDEHDPIFHGGIDKAVHAYCSAHYPSWRAEYPEAADRFVPGGFGENLVLARMNERNVCIGDVVAVGPELVLQVSLPRQPCFKLNHRFRLKNFAPMTWRLSRTGWYYRVLRPGRVQAGDEVKLLERPRPAWTIERVQEYLHRDTSNAAMNEELAGIPELGEECAGQFRKRVAKQKAKEKRELAGADSESRQERWHEYRLVERERQSPRISSFVFERIDRTSHNPDAQGGTAKGKTAESGGENGDNEGAEEEPLKPGSHVKIRLGNGLTRTYSVVSGSHRRFELGVALDAGSRGGSRFLHESVQPGDAISVQRFTEGVPLASAASHHVFVAGGVGITAFLNTIEKMRAINFSVRLHYAVRAADEVPFRERLERLGMVDFDATEPQTNGAERVGTGQPASESDTSGQEAAVVVLYDRSRGRRLDIPAIVRSLPWNSQLYFCGPRRMMDEALRETRAAGLDHKEVHFEAFEADASGHPFEAVVANRGGVAVHVGPEETLLEALRARFGDSDVPSSCEVGNCGTCRLRVVEGRVEHRGTALTEEEKRQGDAMLACVSRGIGRIVVDI